MNDLSEYKFLLLIKKLSPEGNFLLISAAAKSQEVVKKMIKNLTDAPEWSPYDEVMVYEVGKMIDHIKPEEDIKQTYH